MGYGFVDVFNAIGGLVSDVFYKADPKKSDVKNYFDSIAKILKDTQAKLDALSKEQGGGDGGTQVVEASKKASGWIKEMHKAVEDTANAGAGGSESIANVAAGGAGDGAGKKADKDSVTGIAKGMKAIVDAAGKAGVEFKPAAAAGAGGDNDAGRLFASGAAGNAGADANAAQEAAEAAGKAVSAVSGDQILKAIVDAAGSTAGARANTATNAVEAAIGADAAGAAFANAGIAGKNDQIAAAIVLRGLAKDGKFANANNAANTKVVAAKKASGWIKEMHKAVEDTAKAGTGGGESIANVATGGGGDNAGKKADVGSVTGIAKGMKAIVAAAEKAGVEFKPAAAGAANAGDNAAGRLFASGNAGNAGADANAQEAAEAAGKAVSAVSGDQILKAIVDAAETTGGKKADTAKDAVEAAIGDDAANAAGVAFGGGIAGKNDQIAAAIVLRGLAKDGKFANANAAENTKVVASKKAVGWIKEMHKAVEDTANAGAGSGESIANVAAGGAGAGAGAKADVGSVTGIAKGMKAIVAVAEKAGVEFKPDPAAGAGAANAGANAW